MPVVNMLPVLLKEKLGEDYNLSDVQREVGLSYPTVHAWVKKPQTRVDLDSLEVWCNYFNCGVGDIIKVVSEDEVSGILTVGAIRMAPK
jgi:DNA-binding Xre family transcriptional regulator